MSAVPCVDGYISLSLSLSLSLSVNFPHRGPKSKRCHTPKGQSMEMLSEPSQRHAPPTRVLRLGVAGLGVASTLFLPGVEQSPHARIVAAADLRRSAREAFARTYQGRSYGSVEELCDDVDVDVIWIATPNQFHCRHTVMAAEH